MKIILFRLGKSALEQRQNNFKVGNLSPEEEFFIQFHFRRSILTLKFNFDPALKADTECASYYLC